MGVTFALSVKQSLILCLSCLNIVPLLSIKRLLSCVRRQSISYRSVETSLNHLLKTQEHFSRDWCRGNIQQTSTGVTVFWIALICSLIHHSKLTLQSRTMDSSLPLLESCPEFLRMPADVMISSSDTPSFNAALTCDNIVTHSHGIEQLPELPEPPVRPTKCSRKASSPSCSEDKSAPMSKLYTLEQKLDSLGKKVVETAESQTADLKARLCRLKDAIESNCANVQTYSKSLAVVLQDIAKVLDTVKLIQESGNGPLMSPAMLSALITLSREAVKVPYAPKEPVVPTTSASASGIATI